MIKLGVAKKFIAILANLSLLLNSFVPFLLFTTPTYAQEASPIENVNSELVESPPTPEIPTIVESTPTPEITPEITPEVTPEITPEITPEPSPIIIEPTAPVLDVSITPTPEITITPEPTTILDTNSSEIRDLTSEISITPTPSSWTFEKVELNKEYIALQNSQVKLTFTKLPDHSGNIKIEEITLTPEQIKKTSSLSDKAYDITSDMTDGSFTYNLSLPVPESAKGQSIEVKFAEEISKIGTAEKVENTLTKTDTSVSVTSLDHFTFFVVTSLNTQDGCNAVLSGTTLGATCFSTIQAAINAANSDDTINVAAGTYNEQIIVNKKLTINGSNVGISAGAVAGIRGAESIVNGGFSIPATSSTAAGTVIDGFTVQGGFVAGSFHDGFRVGDSSGGVLNVTIQNNIIQNVISGTGSDGIEVVGGSNSLQILNNEIVNNWRGMYLNTSSGITISGNNIHGNNGGGNVGIGSDHQSNLTVINNIIADHTVEGWGMDNVGVSVVAHNNQFTNNLVSIAWYAGTSNKIDATNNWWGSPVLATVQSKVNNTDKVTVTPYYVDSGKTTLSNVALTNVYVDDDYSVSSAGSHTFGYDAFTTIQEGITAVSSGGMINVAAGTYTETDQIVINKNLTIVGADKDTTIIKPAQNTGNLDSGNLKAWFLVDSGATFNLSNVTLDGADKLVATGILSYGNGIIENNIIKNIGYNPSTDYYGRGVQLYNANMTVRNNTLQNIGRIGIFAYGSGVTSAIIDGNNYTGKGTGNWLDYGVELGGGAVATISNNIISGNRGVASDGSTSAGILVSTFFASGTTATVTGNTLTNNSIGIAAGYDGTDTAVVVAHNNNISGNTQGLVSTHLTVDATNNWWGNASGPLDNKSLPGTPNYNNLSGTGNSVTSYVDYKPWFTNSAMATLSSANAITVAASGPTLTDATLNGTNGSYDATGHSFWASLATFSTASPTLPPGVFSTLDLGAIGANTAFSALLSSITGLLPITPSTPYYFAAWASVGGTWYPGAVLTLTTAPTPPPVDITPDAFSLTDQTDVVLSTVIESNTITVAGINASADVSVVGGEYSVNGGAWATTSSAVILGNTVKVRHTSSASNSTAVNTTLTIGDVSDTFTSTTVATSNDGGGGTVAGASTSVSAPVCNDQKPGSAPILLSAVAGANSVTLTWSVASNPTSYYLVTYGDKAGSQQYGNPNVGPAGTTSYTVKSLSGNTTYYFKVRAGNGCTPGDFSNELSATAQGQFITTPATGFEQRVLGEQTTAEPTTISPTPTPTNITTGNVLGSEKTTQKGFDWRWLWLLLIIPAGFILTSSRRRSN